MKDPFEDQKTSPAMAGAITALVLVSVLLWAALNPTAFGIVLMIIALLVVVMLHEAGHYLVARRAGMKATEFFVGFGPRIFSFRRGETEYGIKAVLLGGYVRIIGMSNIEQVEPDDEPRTFRQAPFRWRVAVALAGVTVNLAICFVLFFAMFWVEGSPYASTTVSSVVEASRAERAGLEPDDRILAVDGSAIDPADWSGLVDYVEARPDRPITFTVERGGEPVDLVVTPGRRTVDGEEIGFAGISPTLAFRDNTFFGAVGEAGSAMWNGAVGTAKAFANIFSPEGISRQSEAVTGNASPDPEVTERPVSVVGITAFAGELYAENGFWAFVGLLGAVNLALALFNLIPLLPFDGGHVVIACYEQVASKIRRRRVQADFRKLLPVTAVVFALVLLVGVSSIYLDIRNLFS